MIPSIQQEAQAAATSTLCNSGPAASPWRSLHLHERVAMVYFSLLALWSLARPFAAGRRFLLAALPAAIFLICRLESRKSRAWSRVVREWSSLGLILAAYWALEMFSGGRLPDWEDLLIGWDRLLLDTIGLRTAIEAFGGFVPNTLESAYLGLYTLPHIALGLIYLLGERPQTSKFLLVLFLGTFTAYLMIPFFPLASPRMAFPGMDLPAFQSIPRVINEWLLDHMDISTGVFPSGHVAVAFSCAFGLLSVMPGRRKIWLTAFAVASLIYIATIYGRYHYAVDGLSSITIAALAWWITERLHLSEA